MVEERNFWKDFVGRLIEQNLTVATMESCTGGAIACEITNISGASAVIKESFVTYCNEAKIKHGVPADVIEQYTVYSAETAAEMAKAVKREVGSNIGIGVTGQLGRIDPSNPVEKLNCVWFAICDSNDDTTVVSLNVPDDERKNQKAFVVEKVAEKLLDVLD